MKISKTLSSIMRRMATNRGYVCLNRGTIFNLEGIQTYGLAGRALAEAEKLKFVADGKWTRHAHLWMVFDAEAHAMNALPETPFKPRLPEEENEAQRLNRSQNVLYQWLGHAVEAHKDWDWWVPVVEAIHLQTEAGPNLLYFIGGWTHIANERVYVVQLHKPRLGKEMPTELKLKHFDGAPNRGFMRPDAARAMKSAALDDGLIRVARSFDPQALGHLLRLFVSPEVKVGDVFHRFFFSTEERPAPKTAGEFAQDINSELDRLVEKQAQMEKQKTLLLMLKDQMTDEAAFREKFEAARAIFNEAAAKEAEKLVMAKFIELENA